MKLSTRLHPFHALLAAGMLAGAMAAQAAPGITIQAEDESQVVPGMTTATVLQALGRPALNRSYEGQPITTWTYRVAGNGQAVFDVDFDASGTVVAATERADESGRGHGRR